MMVTMGHTITVDDKSKLLDVSTLQDFIDLFFDAKESEFHIEVVPTYGKVPNGNIRGLMQASNLGRFRITLYAGNIKAHMDRGIALGGNITKANNLTLAVYLVLAHELRHAYQAVYFGRNSTLQAGRYKARAGEVDARRHVDENYDSLCAFLGFSPELLSTACTNPDLVALVDILAESADDLGMLTETDDQVWDQVMGLPGDPDVNHRKVMEGLTARGLRLG